MRDKAALRAEAVRKRAGAHGHVDSTPALDFLAAELENAEGPISFYWPIRTEIDPRPVMEAVCHRHIVCLPLTHGRNAALTFLAWSPGAAMTVDGFGVAVPEGTETVVPRTLVVPMLAFDDRLHRLGYGAGHYDRTLALLRPQGPVRAIGFAYEAQFLTDLPAEPTDQSLDAIVTETGVRRAGSKG